MTSRLLASNLRRTIQRMVATSAHTLGPRAIATLRARLVEGRAALKSQLAGLPSMDGAGAVEAVTDLMDASVRQVRDAVLAELGDDVASAAPDVHLVAIGSYGRRELCPHSDVDLLFLLPDAPVRTPFHERYINGILYGLWDLGLEVGQAVRTVTECLEAAQQDQSILSSLLDARPIDGDSEEPTFRDLERAVDQLLFKGASASRLIAAKLAESNQRVDRFADSIYLLEPNVKESRGGLRELHTARWIARARWRARSLDELRRMGVISTRESRSLERAYGFLLRVRCELHLAAGRRQDILQFRFQELLATTLGYRPPDAGPHDHQGTERFMRAYYFHAHALRHYTELLIERATHHRPRRGPTSTPAQGGFRLWNGMLTVSNRDQFLKDPSALIRLFRVAREESIEVYSYTKDLATHSRGAIDRNARRSAAVVEEFLKLLESPHDDGSALFDLHRLGLLARVIPEWQRISARWQQSLYHVYTVDVHSLEVVRNLKRLQSGDLFHEYPELSRLLNDLPRLAVLLLAAMFHDIGKGWPRGDHSIRGAKVARVAGQRFEEAKLGQWTQRDTTDLAWLVEHHLAMSDIAQRRDISDRHLVEQFAAQVESVERLTMLYLLTVADMRGTSPKVWTDWKGALLRELYEHTSAVLAADGGSQTSMEERRRRVGVDVVEAADRSERYIEPRVVDAFVNAMPARYLQGFSSRQMVRHVQMWRDVSHRGGLAVHVRQLRREDITRVTVVCPDYPGLLSDLSGVLAAHHLDILSASIFSLDAHHADDSLDLTGELPYQHLEHMGARGEHKDRVALDVLYVKHQANGIVDDPHKWEQIRRTLERVVLAQQEVVSVLRARRESRLRRPHRPAQPVKVDVRNHDSRTETVVDVFGPDHPGALHTIARALADLGLSISLAKISTQGDRVADGFYVTDAETGHKLDDPDRIRDVKRVLTEAFRQAAG